MSQDVLKLLFQTHDFDCILGSIITSHHFPIYFHSSHILQSAQGQLGRRRLSCIPYQFCTSVNWCSVKDVTRYNFMSSQLDRFRKLSALKPTRRDVCKCCYHLFQCVSANVLQFELLYLRVSNRCYLGFTSQTENGHSGLCSYLGLPVCDHAKFLFL